MAMNSLFLSRRINVEDPAISALLNEVRVVNADLEVLDDEVLQANNVMRRHSEKMVRRQALLTSVYLITSDDPANSELDGDEWPLAGSSTWLSAVLEAIKVKQATT